MGLNGSCSSKKSASPEARMDAFKGDVIFGIVMNDFDENFGIGSVVLWTVDYETVTPRFSILRKDSSVQLITKRGYFYPPKKDLTCWNVQSCGELISQLSEFPPPVSCDISEFIFPVVEDSARLPFDAQELKKHVNYEGDFFDVMTISGFLSRSMVALTRNGKFVKIDYGFAKFDLSAWQRSHVKYRGTGLRSGGAFNPWIPDFDRYLKIFSSMSCIWPEESPVVQIEKMPPNELCQQPGYWGLIHMAGAPCFLGTSEALMEDGWKTVDSIQVGDVTKSGALVRAVVLSKVSSPDVVFDRYSGLAITSGHPILREGEWFRAGELFPVTRKCSSVNTVYNFVLEPSDNADRVLNVNGQLCATLGLYCHRLHKFGGYRANFYGTDEIVKSLQSRPDWPNIRFEG